MVLSNFSQQIFVKIVVGRLKLDTDTCDLLALWWQNNATIDRYIKRVELAVYNCHSKPEKADGRRLARKLRKTFNETNLLYSKLLGLKTNIFMELWFWPTVSFFKTRPELEVIEKICTSISSFEDITEDNDDDQVLAALEVLANTPADKLQVARLNMLQWSCEEFLRLYGLAKYNHHAGLDLGTTIDEYEVERRELKDAVKSSPWNYKEKKKFLRKLNRLREAMDSFCLNTQAKRDMNDLIRYLTEGFSPRKSIFGAFENTEEMYQALISDSTQRKFWDWEIDGEEE